MSRGVRLFLADYCPACAGGLVGCYFLDSYLLFFSFRFRLIKNEFLINFG